MSELDPTINHVLAEPKPAPVPDVAPEKEPGSAILLWAIGIIVVLILGVFAIRAFYTPEPARGELVTYNNFEFEHKEGLWWTIWQNGNIQFILSLRYNPLQTLNTTITGQINRSFERDTVYVTFDPRPEDQTYVALSAAELSLNLKRALGVDVISACTVNATADCAALPILNCATRNASVIVLQEVVNRTANVLLQDECMVLSGGQLELTRAVDRVLYTFYGIIPSLDTR